MYRVVLPSRAWEPYLLDAVSRIEDETVPAERVMVVPDGPDAHEQETHTAVLDYRGPRRLALDANGWATDRERGQSDLLAESRHLHGARPAVAAGERAAG